MRGVFAPLVPEQSHDVEEGWYPDYNNIRSNFGCCRSAMKPLHEKG